MSEAETSPDKLDEPEVEGPSLEERLQRLEEILSRLEQETMDRPRGVFLLRLNSESKNCLGMGTFRIWSSIRFGLP